MKKYVYLDLHVLQNLPPSCLNRDDTGSPKSAVYGGVRRARVSSQSWKRAMRLMFNDHFDKTDLGIRTKSVFEPIAEEIRLIDPGISEEEALARAKAVLEKVKVKPSKTKGEENKVAALFFMGRQQAKNLAAIALNEDPSDKEIIAALTKNNAVDIALFGRMLADNPLINCDASAQIAHAISTHKADNEYDFFTAVDDLSPEETTGAGHIGTVEYNSATMYRYATVAVHSLSDQLDGDSDALAKAIREFTRAFVCSLPTGRQNSFAANTIPDAVLAAIRTDRPLSFASAFETPVRGEGFLQASAKALEQYALEAYEDFCPNPDKSYVTGRHLAGLVGERLPLEKLLERVGKDAAAMVRP